MKSYIIKTMATVVYENWVEVSDEDIDEYRATDPDYAELKDEEIVRMMFDDGEVEVDDSNPIDWYDEQVVDIREYSY